MPQPLKLNYSLSSEMGAGGGRFPQARQTSLQSPPPPKTHDWVATPSGQSLPGKGTSTGPSGALYHQTVNRMLGFPGQASPAASHCQKY